MLVVTRGTPIVMDYWNADGSAAEMCGNGLRCVARYATTRAGSTRPISRWTHQSGSDRCVGEDLVDAEIGPTLIEGQETIDGQVYRLVDTGNPHAVRVVEDPGDRSGPDRPIVARKRASTPAATSR